MSLFPISDLKYHSEFQKSRVQNLSCEKNEAAFCLSTFQRPHTKTDSISESLWASWKRPCIRITFMNYQCELVAILTISVEYDGVLKYRRSLWMPSINTIWRTITITQQNVETPAKNVARPSKSKVRLESTTPHGQAINKKNCVRGQGTLMNNEYWPSPFGCWYKAVEKQVVFQRGS